jgi:hypothetical protein
MNYEQLRARPVKQNGERCNHHFHLKLSKSEKERLVMLTKTAGYTTMAAYLRDQIFKPDVHYKLDLILKILKSLGEEKDGED